jgi:hypothetical protein
MPAEHRHNPITRDLAYRVYSLPDDLRSALGERRQVLGQTVREFIAGAVEGELDRLVAQLREILPVPGGEMRPARLPLTERLLEALKKAGDETGLPASRLLLACLARAARRKRRRRGTAPPGNRPGRGRPGRDPAGANPPAPAAGPEARSIAEGPDPPAGEEEVGGLGLPARLPAPA